MRTWLCPPLQDARFFAPGWNLRIWLAILGLMLACAGGLHWYFYMRKGQGKRSKVDHPVPARNNRPFDFPERVRENMFRTLTSRVGQVSAFQAVTVLLMATGYAQFITFVGSPVWFLFWPVLIPNWSAILFFWVPRLLHRPVLYAQVHALHHRNVKIGPLSGLSMHPLEHLRYLSALCIQWLVPLRPIHLFFHVIYRAPGAAMTRAGYENPLIRDRCRPVLATVYHRRQDRYFECSYGNPESPGIAASARFAAVRKRRHARSGRARPGYIPEAGLRRHPQQQIGTPCNTD
ncbi:sterol desaturase family protein [Sedimentitalea sp. HM32M-2]|uniref:sterol desaturase family protein n=1 Tax=Sedimentitalea sp. HM32M-2 TaxID=3351566 RepID=UPI0036383CCE